MKYTERIRIFIAAAGFFLAAAPDLSGECLYSRTLQAPGGYEGTRTVSSVAFLPDHVRGLRLVTKNGKEVPITRTSQDGGRIAFFFNADANEEFILEYHDIPVRTKDAPQQSGILHSRRPYAGGPVRSVTEFEKLWKSGKGTRRRWTEQVFEGRNPLGNAKNSLNRYRGYLKIPSDGKYTFFTASTDSSFLLIRGKVIAQCPGQHNVCDGQRGEFRGTAYLKKGVYPFEYLHANSQWNYYAIAAWGRPGKRECKPIPIEQFVPCMEAIPGPAKDAAGKAVRELTWKRTGVLDIEGKQIHELRYSDGKLRYFYHFVEEKRSGYTVFFPYAFHEFPMLPDKDAERILHGAITQDTDWSDEAKRYLVNAVFVLRSQSCAFQLKQRIMNGMYLPEDALWTFLNRSGELGIDWTEAELWKLAGGNSAARLFLARRLLEDSGNAKKAAAEYKKTKLNKLSKDAQFAADLLAGDLLLIFDSWEAAALHFAKMKHTEPNGLECAMLESRYRTAIWSTRYAESEQLWTIWEERAPGIRMNPSLLRLRCGALSALKQNARAAFCAHTILRVPANEAETASALLFLGKHEKERKSMEQAKLYFVRIIKEHPKSLEALSAAKELLSIEKGNEKP